MAKVRDYESVSSAAKQAGQVLRSSKATKEQKHEAVKVLGAAVATESGKKVVEHTVREARKALKTPAGRPAAKNPVSANGISGADCAQDNRKSPTNSQGRD